MEEHSLDDDLLVNSFTNELKCKKYSKSDLKHINCFFVYVDQKRSIEAIKKNTVQLSIPNTFLKNELCNLVKNHNKHDNKIYGLTYLLKYNFNIDESDLKNMSNFCFLETVDTLSDILFHPSIEVIHDINSLFFVFLEKNSMSNKNTKKNYTKPNKKTNKNFKTSQN